MQSFRIGALAAAFVLGGCAAFPAGRGLNETHQLVADRGVASAPAQGPRDCTSADAEVSKLAAQSLTADAAVQLALLCNVELAADYARLGIARAEAFQAVRFANPTLHAAMLDSSAHSAPAQIELGLVQNFTNLLLRGAKTRSAEGEFLRTQQLLAGSVLRTSAEAKADYYTLVGAQQVASMRHAIADALQTGYDLAQRFHDAGNLTAHALAQSGADLAEAQIAARRADDDVAHARARLELRLGVPATVPWSVPDRMALPVLVEDETPALQARAAQNRLDLAAATHLVTLLADNAETTRKYRWLGDVEVGISYEREPDRSRLLGPSLSIQLPIFDQGQGALARVTALQDWSAAERRRLTQSVDTEVRLAAQRVHSARARSEDYRGNLIPQRQTVVARTQEEVNFMLSGVFELIGARRAEFEADLGYLEALRDYWIARADLERAVGANVPSAAQPAADSVSVQQLLASPPAKAGRHHHHRDMPMPESDPPHADQHGEQP